MLLHIKIPDRPISLKRPRAALGRFYDPQHDVKEAYKKYIQENIKLVHDDLAENIALLELPLTLPVAVRLNFYFEMPKSWSKKKRHDMLDMPHTQTPDLDNLVKFFQDALNGYLWGDDRQIWNIEAFKMWSDENYTNVRIWTCDDSD